MGPTGPDIAHSDLPLDDLRVLEIGYGLAAPVCARILGQFGADVIRIESVRRPDSLRTSGAGWVPLSVPWEVRRDTGIGINGFSCPEKRSVGLELDTTEGMALFRDLVAVCDVLVMNISVDAVEGLGIRYEDLLPSNPGLVYLNLFAFASTGPYARFRTWGGNLSALAGISGQVGWPDRTPSGLPLSFPDYPSAFWGATAITAAILQRDVTGRGCELEISQFQVATQCIAPTIAETVLRGEAPERTGDQVRGSAPDGIFPTRDEGRFVALSVMDDEAWERLSALDGLDDLADDPSLADLAGRLRRRDEIGERLARWTSSFTAWEVAWRLQEAGVAAFPVVDQFEVLGDEHLASRSFFRALPHARFGAELSYGQAVHLSETPARATRAAPAFGEHTREVLGELLGLGDDRIDELVAAEVVTEMTHRDVRLERPFYGWIGSLVRASWPASSVEPADALFARLDATYGEDVDV